MCVRQAEGKYTVFDEFYYFINWNNNFFLRRPQERVEILCVNFLWQVLNMPLFQRLKPVKAYFEVQYI